MKKNFKYWLFLLCILIIGGCKNEINNLPDKCTYKVTFNFYWNSTDFPVEYPAGAHFSRLIGWSHLPTTQFFRLNSIASLGIESMAETGGTTILSEEIEARIASGEGYKLVVGDYLASGTGEISVEIEVTPTHSAITLATMLAPSPDWYVAIVNVNLLEDDHFISAKTIEAQVFDAGSDSGPTFTSENEDTDPREPISLLVKPPLGDGPSIHPVLSTVTISKI